MNINPLAAQCSILQHKVGNIESWVWPTRDTQTYGLILRDWVDTIRPYVQEKLGTEKSGSVIQAGGNCGVYPLLYTEMFTHVYTFEPDPLSFFCLVNNCQIPGIVKFNAALGASNGLVVMNEVASENRGMNKVAATENGEDASSIPVVAIDSFDFSDVRLMQLDLEGYEIAALEGAKKTIEKYKPIIILECSDVGSEYYHEVHEAMANYGYKSDRQLNRLDVAFVHSG